jgi:hypothetical protein
MKVSSLYSWDVLIFGFDLVPLESWRLVGLSSLPPSPAFAQRKNFQILGLGLEVSGRLLLSLGVLRELNVEFAKVPRSRRVLAVLRFWMELLSRFHCRGWMNNRMLAQERKAMEKGRAGGLGLTQTRLQKDWAE